MNKIFTLFILIFSHTITLAQYNEVGIFIGGANAVTDIGKGSYINPNKFAYGLLYKRNINKHLSARADVRSMKLWDNDNISDIQARKKRLFSFENNLFEISIGAEYHFLEFDVHQIFQTLFTPYIFSGITYFRTNSLVFINPNLQNQHAVYPSQRRDDSLAIPFALGIKTRFGKSRFLFGAEVGMRYTFTNNLDGSFPKNENLRFGNQDNNDWYFVSGFYITYSFGIKPCYCF